MRLTWTRRQGRRAIATGAALTAVAFVLFMYSASILIPAVNPIPAAVIAVVLGAAELLGVGLVLVGLYALTGRLDKVGRVGTPLT